MGLVVEVKVVVQSGQRKCVFETGGQLKCFLRSAPEKGKANDELIRFLSKELRIAKDKISIVHGKTTRLKRLKIDADISFEQLLKKLGIERQLTITRVV